MRYWFFAYVYIDSALYYYHQNDNLNKKFQINSNIYTSLFINKINEKYSKMGYVNLNEVEGKINVIQKKNGSHAKIKVMK